MSNEAIDKTVEEKLKQILFERARTGRARKVIFAIAVVFAFIEIFYVMHYNITLSRLLGNLGLNVSDILNKPDILNQLHPAMAIILGMIIAGSFIMYPISRKRLTEEIPWYDWVLAFIGFLSPLYIVYLFVTQGTVEGAIKEATPVTILLVFSMLFFIAEATRRALGWILPAVMSVFLAYAITYAYNSAPPTVEGLNWIRSLLDQIVSQNLGILGTPFRVMVLYVFVFLFFSSMMEKLGIGRYITDLILSLVGKKPGGPAKVAVLSSALMGTISGSSVANTLTTGTFTIPTMKRAGFPPEVAGAIEPVASTGGQLMPPIMGAAAFIMAEFLRRPYRDIIIAAFLPAIIYFYSIYVFVDKEAKRRRVKGLRDEEVPDFKKLVKKIYLILPIPMIAILLLFMGPRDAVFATVSLTVVFGWLASQDLTTNKKLILIGLLLAFLILPIAIADLTIGSAFFFAGGISIILALIAPYLVNGGQHVKQAVIEAVESTFRNSVAVFLAAGSAGIVQTMITYTQLHLRLKDILIEASMGYLYLLLIMTAIFSIILGMGVPTTANYVITATVLAPAIIPFAVDIAQNLYASTASVSDPTVIAAKGEAIGKLASHMFVFYYGILADITPPVALAAFVGATLARADFWKTAINATIFGFAKYILPFVFVASPIILLVDFDWTTRALLELGYTVGSLLLIIHVASSGFTGYLAGHITNKYLRAAMVLIAILSVSLKPYFVAAALILYLLVYAYNKGIIAIESEKSKEAAQT